MKKKEKEFEEYKAEYSLSGTTAERKTVLIELMRKNLKNRYGKGSGPVLCIDGIVHSLDSESVPELYAIDSALRAEERVKDLDVFNDELREGLLGKNKYNPDNPYTGK